MLKRMAHATKTHPTPPRITRMTRNNQVTLAKSLTEPRGLTTGALFEVEDVPEGFLFRPLTVTTPSRLAADRARGGIGLSRPFDNAKDFIEDLDRVTKKRRTLARVGGRSNRTMHAHPPHGRPRSRVR